MILNCSRKETEASDASLLGSLTLSSFPACMTRASLFEEWWEANQILNIHFWNLLHALKACLRPPQKVPPDEGNTVFSNASPRGLGEWVYTPGFLGKTTALRHWAWWSAWAELGRVCRGGAVGEGTQWPLSWQGSHPQGEWSRKHPRH